MQEISVHDIFPHVRIVMGMVIGLGVTRLLSGLARIIQHPTQYRVSWIHLAWVASLMLTLVHFWWWEFGLYKIQIWTFGTYLFVIAYAVSLFMLCALLFPESMQGYGSYGEYFFSKRAWFFGMLALTYLLDIIDTLIKGEDYFARFRHEYLLRTPILVLLCLLAIWSRDRRVHVAIVGAILIYQISWIFRLFDTIGYV